MVPPNHINNQDSFLADTNYFDPLGQQTKVVLISTENPHLARVVLLPTLLLIREFQLVQQKCRLLNNLDQATTDDLIETAFRQPEVKQTIQGKPVQSKKLVLEGFSLQSFHTSRSQ